MGIALLVGISLGLNSPIQFPTRYARYSAILILAAVDAVLGAGVALRDGSFQARLLISGLLFNAVMAGILSFIGDALGLELYFAAIVAFGIRIFNNLGRLRRKLV